MNLTTSNNPPAEPAPRRKRWPRVVCALLVVLAVLAGGLYLGDWWLPSVAKFLDVTESVPKCDYVLVLGGGLQTRPFGAAALYRAGVTSKVVLTQPTANPMELDGLLPSTREVFMRTLLASGVEEEDIIVLPGTASSTFDEAQALARFLADKPDARVVAVTNSFHTRRARWILRHVNPRHADRITMAGVPTEYFDDTNWHHTLDGWTTYLNEYAKFIWYRLRYW